MKKTVLIFTTIGFIFFSLVFSAHATLIDMRDGTIYDNDAQVSWIQDANVNNRLMNWEEAKWWAVDFVFAGFDNWDLPSITDFDHLFYDELGGTLGSSILDTGNSYLALFYNLQDNEYWSSSMSSAHPYNAWAFQFDGGVHFFEYRSRRLFAWAVRYGERPIPSVPEPSSLILFGSGMTFLIALKRKIIS